MTLVNDDEVKEITLILHIIRLVGCTFRQRDTLFLCPLCIGRSHHRLEDSEVKVTGCGHLVIVLPQLLRCHTAHGIFGELVEVVNSLIGKNVPVGNKQDSWSTLNTLRVPFRLSQLPAYLESRIGFSCSGCHGQQDMVALLGNSLQNVLDGNFLIVARLAATTSIQSTEIKLVSPRVLIGERHLPQILWRRKTVYIIFLAGDDIFSLIVLNAHVDEPDLITIGAIGVTNLQGIGIELCLVNAFCHILLVTLCLYHGKFHSLVFKDVVCLLGILVACCSDAPRCNIGTLLHKNLTSWNNAPTSIP